MVEYANYFQLVVLDLEAEFRDETHVKNGLTRMLEKEVLCMWEKVFAFLYPLVTPPPPVGLYLAMPNLQRERHKLEVNGFFGKELERATTADLESSKATTIETYL